MNNRSILVEGWLFYGHSFSIVNEWQLLELTKRSGIDLYFKASPPVHPAWRARPGLRTAEEIHALCSLRCPQKGATLDFTFRIAVPISFEAAKLGRTYVFCVAESGWFPRRYTRSGRTLSDLLGDSDALLVTPSLWSRWGLLRAGADPARVRVVPHGTDTDTFYPGESAERETDRSKRGWSGRFVFLNVSAMSLNKGVDLLLKAFARVAMRRPEALLVLKGADPVYGSSNWLHRCWREKLTPEERKACLSRVQYIGGLGSFDRVAGLFRAADAYVTPYRAEGFNLPALEAVASGLPLICTEGGPTNEFTTPDFACRIPARLVPEGWRDPEELVLEPSLDGLSQAMMDVIENASFRERARVLGPAFVRNAWTWKEAVDKLLDAFGAA